MLDDFSREEIVQTIDRFVDELLDSASVSGPPVNAIHLAQRHLGMVICLDEKQPQRGRAQRSGKGKLIYLRREPTGERHQWTVAHEIGEHLKVSVLQRLGVESGQTPVMAGESLANLFAYHLLVPQRWFADEATQLNYDVLALKKRYHTASHEVIAWRLLDLPSPAIITIIDNDHIYRRRSNAWPTRRHLEPVEEECQRYVHYYSRPKVIHKDQWTVHGWPVHQPDWKREILRSVVDSDG
jgi:Zn-dependent peptidase ImmA (M78 family)